VKREKADLTAELTALLASLNPRAVSALRTILEIVASIDRRRASRLLEAIGTLIAIGPRRRGGGK
jgi:hypothetical protein